MGTLVAELLELARLDRTSSLDITETDLAVLVRDAAADARAVEPARPVRAEAPESLVAVVDEARIRQVLANLLGNVREHTPVTTPTAVRLAQVRGGVVVEVADSGPGMAADDAARAFDRFHRGAERHNGGPAAGPAVGYGTSHGAGAAGPHSANGSRPAAESGGSGLGLAIVAAIAQAHGGQATLESAPSHGTRVRVWLPATTPATPATPRLAATPPVAATPRLSRAKDHPGLPAPMYAAPPTPAPPAPAPPAPASPAPHSGDVQQGPAELHHDWGDPPQPVPPPGPPDRNAARDGDGHAAPPPVAPWRRLPPPGRHGRVSWGPQPGDEGRVRPLAPRLLGQPGKGSAGLGGDPLEPPLAYDPAPAGLGR
jgi:hypothetical protein